MLPPLEGADPLVGNVPGHLTAEQRTSRQLSSVSQLQIKIPEQKVTYKKKGERVPKKLLWTQTVYKNKIIILSQLAVH